MRLLPGTNVRKPKSGLPKMMMTKKRGKKVAYNVGDRVVINENYHWDVLWGAHGLVTAVGGEEHGATPERPYSVYVDGRPGNSPLFAEIELDPEVP